MTGEERDGMHIPSSRVFHCNAGNKKQICQRNQASQQVVIGVERIIEEKNRIFSFWIFLYNTDDTL